MATWKMTFENMYADVQARVRDTSGDLLPRIKTWLNQRQADIWYRHPYDWATKFGNISLTQSLADYDLQSDFSRAVVFYETETPRKLGRTDLVTFRLHYPNAASDSEAIPHTVIFLGRATQVGNNVPAHKIKVHPIPDRDMTLYDHYWPHCDELVNEGDVSLLHPLGHVVMVDGATADACLARGQPWFALAKEYEAKYEVGIRRLIAASRQVDFTAPLKLRRRLPTGSTGFDLDMPPQGWNPE